MSSNYPMGAEYCSKAPFNQKDVEPKEIEVTVSITLSKTVKVKVDDYEEDGYLDEDGSPCIDYDFSNCDLYSAVKQQVDLPYKSKRFRDWVVDDFEVVKE